MRGNAVIDGIDELQEVRGIGPAKFEALEPMITVGP